MNFTPASSTSLFAFGLVILLVVVPFVAAVWYSSWKLYEPAKQNATRVGVWVLVWLIVLSVVVQSGILQEFIMPLVPVYFVCVMVCVGIFCFSIWGAKLALATPISFLVAFHMFRLPLELVLNNWAMQGVIPATMTWTGRNWDVFSGILAFTFAPVANRVRFFAWLVNIVGFLLLLNVFYVVIMSSPFPFSWGVSPPLQLVFYFPYSLIVPVCAGGALAGHIILTRALLYHRRFL